MAPKKSTEEHLRDGGYTTRTAGHRPIPGAADLPMRVRTWMKDASKQLDPVNNRWLLEYYSEIDRLSTHLTKNPLDKRALDELADLEETGRYGFAEAGLEYCGPKMWALYDLNYRVAKKRGFK
jgi:hypothetical protein